LVIGEGELSVSHPGRFISLENSPRYLLNMRLGGLQRRSGRGAEDRKSLPRPCWESNPGCAARSLVTVLTETSQFRPGFW